MENNINDVLATKQDWRKAERRKSDRRIKDGTAEQRKTTADALRQGKIKCNDDSVAKADNILNESFFIALILAIIFAITFLAIKPAHAENCQDPSTLSPKMKKAYYELKKASQELGGFKVSIECQSKGY